MRNLWRNSLVFFFLLSLLIHSGAWMALYFAPKRSFLPKRETVEVIVLDQSPRQKSVVVEQNEKPLNDEIPEDSKYLSAHNQRVKRETRAQNIGDFKNGGGVGGSGQRERPASKARSRVARGTLPTLASLVPKFDPTGSRENSSSPGDRPVSQTNDYLKEVSPSLETLLNTREFVYYSYYQRIRTQIRQFWEPSIRAKVKKIFAQGRTIASEHDHVTRVIIVLDREGGLLTVQIVGESGVKDLDDAAIEAFRAAEPFPNPPKGIVEADGTIHISWDFILEA